MTKAHPQENDVKNAVKKLLDRYGWFHVGVPAATWGTNGISDRIALRKGLFMAIEVKLKKATGTAGQEEFLQNVRDNGGIGVVVNQAGLERFEELLQIIARRYP